MEDFIAQLSDEDLASIFRGEGMCSPKVTAGTGSAFGGLTESLRGFGIPATCTTDGPSGMRMDVGTKAFSLPWRQWEKPLPQMTVICVSFYFKGSKWALGNQIWG